MITILFSPPYISVAGGSDTGISYGEGNSPPSLEDGHFQKKMGKYCEQILEFTLVKRCQTMQS